MQHPEVLDHAIWWHVYPLGACGATIRGHEGGDQVDHLLPRLEPWLDHVVELGCNGLLLGPVFASSTHGYDTLDHFRIDPRLGDEDDWRHFVEAAHAKGLLVMLDGVFNHVGALHPLVEAARSGGGMVHLHEDTHRGWEGHDDLAELDHDDPRVVDLVTDVMNHWLDRGADGWRLDVAYAVPGPFWAEVLGRVRERHPDAFFLGEVIHGDYAQIAHDGTLDAVTAYELWKAVWSSIKEQNLWELDWTLQRHEEFASKVLMQTFVGNHDVDRIASVVGDTGAAIAAAILFTVPGMPSVYYGDEEAFRGTKLEGFAADDQVRPPLPASPDELSEVGQWLFRLYQQLIGIRRRHPWITRGHLAVGDKTNTTMAYAVTNDGHRLDVAIDLVDQPHVVITADGEEQLRWPQ